MCDCNFQSDNNFNTYKMVSCIGFLIGVPENALLQFPDGEKYVNELKENNSAVIMRCLCNIRSSLMSKWRITEQALVYDMINLDRHELYKADVAEIVKRGVDFIKVNSNTNEYIIWTNSLIESYFSKIKDLFPSWVNLTYIKSIFLMPNGRSIKSVCAESSSYRENYLLYPYGRYINFRFSKNTGNILYNDEKFLVLLYKQNGKEFKEHSKVRKASDNTKTKITEFLNNQNKVIIVVDCENSDVFKLASAITQLSKTNVKKITKIVLFDDINTTSAWKYLQTITGIPVEYILVERIKHNKSLVDMKICAEVTKEVYKNNVLSFILASSDSDYWGMISSLPEANFLLLIEDGKCSESIKNALDENDTPFCNLDLFGTGETERLKNTVIENAIDRSLLGLPLYNLHEIIEDCCDGLKINVSNEEKENLYQKYSKRIKFKLNANGDYLFTVS